MGDTFHTKTYLDTTVTGSAHEVCGRWGIRNSLFATVFGIVFGSQPLRAASFEALCSSGVLDDIPQGGSEPLVLRWRDDGDLDVLRCGRDSDTKKITLSRWATIHLPGVRAAEHNGVRQIMLDTSEGSIPLGDLSSQPCLPQSRAKGRIICSLIMGQKKDRKRNPVSWFASLTLGEDAGPASESVFFPHVKDIPVTKEETAAW